MSQDTLRPLIDRLDAAVRLGDDRAVTGQIKAELERSSARREIVLPDRFRHTCGDSYARRLLHRAPAEGYTVVVMTWGPGQRTALHDHAGVWCVECVIEGELDVTQYDVVERRDDRFRFVERQKVRARVGTAGCLIPPYEYHVLGNGRTDETSISLHVYGGEMDHCNLYQPHEDPGWWLQVPKTLNYDA